MARYDFGNLSHPDFEELVRDLLQAEWGIALEAFKTGRDSGIDLRHIPAGDGGTIIQCKHFLRSGYAKLLAELRDREKPKIERLQPKRYIVATSVGLTPLNKDAIVEALHPFVQSARDVLGADDLEGLLSRHPEVLRAHFKLWLTCTEVIERVLHNAQLCQTEFAVERIRRKLPVFVQSRALPRAVTLLEENRVAVISGAPGIGKTTLAEVLLYSHVEQGFEPVVIQADIAEGRTFFHRDTKRIFYYDDFLGQIFLRDRPEYLGRNQDAALIDFMEMVRGSKHARFILTTREHILRSALQASERLAHSGMLDARCVLELSDYSFAHKARILYNHLYFSALPQSYKEEVLAGDFFLEVIKHQHFNPRLIEWLAADLRGKEIPASQFRSYIIQMLDSPHDIWRHAFENQLSTAARDVLLSFYTLGEWTSTADLGPAFRQFHQDRSARYKQPIAAGDFKKALQELDGAFLIYSAGQARYLNPSIREFIASVIANDPDTAEDLLGAVIRFKQLAALSKLAEECPGSEVASILAAREDLLLRASSRAVQSPSMRWEKSPDGFRGTPIDMGPAQRIGFLMQSAESRLSLPLWNLALQAGVALLESWSSQVPDYSDLLYLMREVRQRPWIADNGGRQMVRRMLDAALAQLQFARASDWIDILDFAGADQDWSEADQAQLDREFERYRSGGIDDERFDCRSAEDLSSMRDFLADLGKKAGVDLSADLASIDQDIAERLQGDEDSDFDELRSLDLKSYPSETIITDDDVRSLFGTLRCPA